VGGSACYVCAAYSSREPRRIKMQWWVDKTFLNSCHPFGALTLVSSGSRREMQMRSTQHRARFVKKTCTHMINTKHLVLAIIFARYLFHMIV
jgi:hypothetical protein